VDAGWQRHGVVSSASGINRVLRTAPSPVRGFGYDRLHIALRDAPASSQQEPP